jgi:ubiquinone/menaquinone biosynthesis C-methylase UbiE
MSRRIHNQNQKIKEDYYNKRDSYYESNYVGSRNTDRIIRQNFIAGVLKKLNITNKTFLDAGSGPAVLGELVKENSGIYYASDLSIHNLESGKKRIGEFNACVADNCALPFADETFDCVACIGSVEYIPQFNTAISELCRLTKKGGYLIVTLANKNSPANWINDRIFFPQKKIFSLFAKKPIYKRYFTTQKEFEKIAKLYNFEIKEVVFNRSILLGNNLNKLPFLKQIESYFFRKIKKLERAKMEIMIVAERKV